ncbi:multidrug effflux MFS transporter [Vannielia sp.]|uniref:multidrug effflux MFS transporter n=1 Tax=Vannielia sp. TaxID=2813045 RepID=UPI002631ADDB|nr:multidrug effflux MFS transporter [Vannielia sp.]MDF1871435.1 multidrug effflux MFS transporter [Vannielia sp.]
MSYGHSVRFADRSTPPHAFTLVMIAAITPLTMNMFLPSLPAMTVYFNTTEGRMGLAVSLFLAANAVLQIMIGPLSDWFGRRPVLIGSLVIYAAATLGCIYATTVETFLFFRLCQAVVASGIVLSRAIIRDVVPMEQAASTLGWVTMGVSLVPMVAPAIGGLLDGWFGWRSSFWLMAGFGFVLLGMVLLDLGETLQSRQARFSQQFRGYPALLTSYRFWGYAFSAACASGAFFAYVGGAPFLAVKYFGLEPATMGALFGFCAVGYLIGNGFSGAFSTRIGINRMVLWGAIITMTGLCAHLLLFLAGMHHPILFFAFFTFVGLGNGLVMPNANAGIVSVRPDLAGSASGLGGALMIGSGAALSALSATMLGVSTNPLPLLIIMLCSAVSGFLAILLVIWRTRQLGVG